MLQDLLNSIITYGKKKFNKDSPAEWLVNTTFIARLSLKKRN